MRQPLPIILDTDIGNDPDDLLALAMVLDRPDLFDFERVAAAVRPECLPMQPVEFELVDGPRRGVWGKILE